ncbi:MAG: MOSC domain-containing protein, partial [Saprospiraceae bacterium]|nr:MOSC domain-containing protein [Saprospiraceae bacterium]
LHIYPVKSLGGIALEEATVEIRGLKYDRRWMLVDEEGMFVSQREVAAMSGLGTAFVDGHLHIFVKKQPGESLCLPLEVQAGDMVKTRVQVWSSRCGAMQYPPEVNRWFSDILNRPLRLVYMPDTTRRRVDGRYAPAGQIVSYADGFPYLLIGEASLVDLQQRLGNELPMNRFRPNLVVRNSEPFEEDHWSDFRIGEVLFRGVKPCARCIVPNTNQETGIRGAEPLKTLAGYRKKGNKILFGQNVVLLSEPGAVLRLGDAVFKNT